uniref:BTB domain-containing protein n=1 Tax=Physcomitrium patens TaxID=3218 RepID=A0A7I4CDD2_PHYPA
MVKFDEADEHDFETLNVGGMKFVTTVSTLTKRDTHSVLAVMTTQRHEKSKVLRDEDGCMFIDRDGTHFRHVLNWLRDGVVTPELETPEYHEILREAEYYMLSGLVEAVLLTSGKKREDVRAKSGAAKEVRIASSITSQIARMARPELSRLDVIKLQQHEHGVRVRGVNLSGLNLSNLDLREGDFRNAQLINTTFDNAYLMNASFENCEATGASFKNAMLHYCDFTGSEMVGVVLDGAILKDAELKGACLQNASLRNASLVGAEFDDADLYKANLTRADMCGAKFRKANLTEANLTEANLSSKGREGGTAILTQARLTRTNFFQANLKNVNVSEAWDYQNAVNLNEAIGYTAPKEKSKERQFDGNYKSLLTMPHKHFTV